jgi:guanylate kinase
MSEFKPKGLVICVSGPSGVGKGTIIDELRRVSPDTIHSISVTTRTPRPGEIDGVHYYFRTTEEFEHMMSRGDILEHDCYCGNYYGTPRAPLIEATEQGHDVVMDVTVPGSLAVMKNFPDAVTLFLLPPSFTELRRRLTRRGTEDQEVVERRLQKARDEIEKTRLFQYVVVNDEIQQTARKILSIVEAERCRYEQMAGIEKLIMSK